MQAISDLITFHQMLTTNILAILFLLTLSSGQTPPAPEPTAADGPSSPANCLVSMLNVSDCFSYVQVGSNEIKPEPACCPELAGMVQSSPECVCNLLGGGASPRFGVKLDKQRAEQLSTICGVKAPSPSLCSGTLTHCVHLLFYVIWTVRYDQTLSNGWLSGPLFLNPLIVFIRVTLL